MLLRVVLAAILALAPALAAPAADGSPPWDLSWLAGVEYTPARVPGNSLWWWRWPELRSEVSFELSAASRHFGLNHLRMFLHSMVYDGLSGHDNGTVLHIAMAEFLDEAERHGFKVSFTFFDDCWNHAGANLTVPCKPVKGRHNGCWMAIPQDVERTSVERFKPYVYNTVRRFAKDKRIAFWEIFNEPSNANTFSLALRSAAFQWAKQALLEAGSGKQAVPVISCWDDNNSTEVVDMHRYDTNFTGWTEQVFANPSKGAVITEGGSRWYQGYDSDNGSPLTVLRWLHSLRSITPSAEAPFKFGMVTNWELMVGESNTRWHWNTKDGSPEPVIPWDGYLFPDGSPVSYTEAAAVRNWTRGVDEFLAFDDFLPQCHLFEGDSYLCLQPGQVHWAKLRPGVGGQRLLVETTVWLNASTGGGVVLRASETTDENGVSGYFAGWRGASPESYLSLERWDEGGATTLAEFDMSSLDCGLTKAGWNMLRVLIDGPQISVYANPMYTEAISSPGIQPRISWTGAKDWRTGGVALVATGPPATTRCTRFDYIGVLDPDVMEARTIIT